MDKNEEYEDFTELLKFLKIGKEYKIYYDQEDYENEYERIVEVRAIVDNEVVVLKTKSPLGYGIENLEFIKRLYEADWIVLNNNKDDKNE
jgi:hypothetical protein